MRKLALLIGLCWVLVAQPAEAVPQTVSFTGRLSTSTGPVTGSVNLTFKLYDVATGGTDVWSEVRNGVGANNQGLVFVDLGEVTTLDSALFTGTRMYLEITVGSEVLAPRLAINSVPYAMQTDNATTLGGAIMAGDVITGAAGTAGITATKTGNMLNVGLTTTGCSNGEVFKFNGTTFACAADNNTLPAAGTGIAVSGNTVSLITTGCSTGEVYKFNGTTFACAADNIGISAEVDGIVGNEVTQATNGSLTRSGTGTAQSPYSLALNTANANTWSATQSFVDIKVSGTAQIGLLRVAGTAVAVANVLSSCPGWNGATCYNGTATATCPTGTRVIGGGCNFSGGYVEGVIHRSYPITDTAWHCSVTASVNSRNLTPYALCARVAN